MMEVFFGSPMAVAMTVGVIALLAVIGWHFVNRDSINHWGWSLAGLGAFGLAACFGAIFRDDYVDSVLASTDPSVPPGLFATDSWVSYVGYAGGAVALGGWIAGLFLRRPNQRRILFFVVSAAIIVKIVVVEGARLSV